MAEERLNVTDDISREAQGRRRGGGGGGGGSAAATTAAVRRQRPAGGLTGADTLTYNEFSRGSVGGQRADDCVRRMLTGWRCCKRGIGATAAAGPSTNARRP